MLIAPVTSFRPDVAKLNSSSGRVTTRPPPISRVRMYWLHETRKAKSAPTMTPGTIAGRVMYQNVLSGVAPRLRA